MATFILVHGSFHAAWNWHRLLPLLRQRGHQCLALDLPGHGRDPTPPHAVTLERCVDALGAAIGGLDEKVVLVAHSRNGIVISQAAERFPDRIAALVYLAAYLVPNGCSMMDYAIEDRESLVVRNLLPRFSRRRAQHVLELFRRPLFRALLPRLLPRGLQTHSLDPAAYREALYHDCAEDITELAHALLEAEPNWAGFTPLRLSAARYGSVPRVYVECLQARAVTLALQRRMQLDSPCARVFSLDSGHSPFFSQPGVLAQSLIDSLEVAQQ